MGAAAFVLIIACANVANLTLMRGVRREHELVVRAALGAGTARLRRLLLAENLLLALMGSMLGLVLAFGGVRMLIALRGALQPARRRDSHRRHGARVHAAARDRRGDAPVVRADVWRSEDSLSASLSAGGAARDGRCVRQRTAADAGRRAGRGVGDPADRRWAAHAHDAAPAVVEHRA